MKKKKRKKNLFFGSFIYFKKEKEKQVPKLLRNCFFFLVNLVSSISEVQAVALDQGEQLFLKHCNVCHVGGRNVIIPEKNLRKRTLEVNGMNTVEAIRYQITNGKNGMPAFGGRLEEKEIEKIAIYVLDQSNKTFATEEEKF